MFLQYIVNTIQSAPWKFKKENFEEIFIKIGKNSGLKIL